MTAPLVISWRGQQVRVRHDDAHLGPYSPAGAVIRNAIELATDARGLQLALDGTVGDRYRGKTAVRPGNSAPKAKISGRILWKPLV
jgi:hypothetical protein